MEGNIPTPPSPIPPMDAPMARKPPYRILSLREFIEKCDAMPETYVVEGLISEAAIALAVGDSGLGKSPWAYQLGMCVSCGIPFLGHQVKQGTVLYVDLENGRSGISGLGKSLARHLGLAELPENFYPLIDQLDSKVLEQAIKERRPVLVIIDSLRAFRPDAEQKNESAGRLMNDLRQWARPFKVSFLIIHHIKKPDEKFGHDSLEDASNVMTWLLKASGARALINQSDVRIALDSTPGIGRMGLKGPAKNASDDIGLVVRGFARLRGEFGPLYLARDRDEDGCPLGYRKLSGLELLFNHDQEEVFQKLPTEFSLKQAKQIYGRRDQATIDFLQKLIRIGVLKHPAKGGPYIKVADSAEHAR